VHAFSDVRYMLGGAYSRFLAEVGLDDETGAGGSVVFEVFGDNVSLFNSEILTGNQARVNLDVNIAGVNELRLVVTNAGDGDGLDHADWANARLIPQQAGSDIRINFQLDSATTPAGYLEDAGFLFGNRGNGYSYGWSSDHTDVSRDRNNNADQRLDTVIQFHAGQTWEIELPNGAYAVTAVIGDAGFSSVHTLNVEGVPYWTNLSLATNQFAEKTLVVTVADGRITLDPGNAPEKNTRINYIEITPLGADIELLSFASADLTLNGKLSYADVLGFDAGWGNHSSGATLEQLVRAGDLNFDGVTDASDWGFFYQAWSSAGMPPLSLAAVLNPTAGDFTRDGMTDGSDIDLWRTSYGSTSELASDGNGDAGVDVADYVVWRKLTDAQGTGSSVEESFTGTTSRSPSLQSIPRTEGLIIEAATTRYSLSRQLSMADSNLVNGLSHSLEATRGTSGRPTPSLQSTRADREAALLICLIRQQADDQFEKTTEVYPASADEEIETLKPSVLSPSDKEMLDVLADAWLANKELHSL
jgi:hypothetical protein